MEDSRTILDFLSSVLPRSLFLGRDGAVCLGEGAQGRSLGHWGGQKELCQCVFIGWPGEGTVLRESVGTPGCGSLENAVSPSVLELICP